MSENKKKENPKGLLPKGISMIAYPTSKYGTVKTVSFCVQCGDKRSLISSPNTPRNLECQTCKSEFSVVIHK